METDKRAELRDEVKDLHTLADSFRRLGNDEKANELDEKANVLFEEYRTLKLKFRGIDDFNQPIFKVLNKQAYYGTNDILFSANATAEEVIQQIEEKGIELVYFGTSFNCEPHGYRLQKDIKIEFIK